MRLQLFAMVVLGWALALDGFAQAPNPVVEHYRAYQAALTRGDIALAEREAAAALAASQTRDGNGGRTPVLAFNLALVRLEAGQREAALAPARLAQELASAESGVDPFAAQLVVGRAQLASPRAGSSALIELINDPRSRSPALSGYAFDAAVDLGNTLLNREQYDEAQPVWRLATALAGENEPLAAAHAYIGLGVSFLMSSRNRELYADTPRINSHLVIRPEVTSEVAAGQAFQEAGRLAQRPAAATFSLSPDVRIYAEAMAWHAVLRARALSQNVTLPPEILNGMPGVAASSSDVPLCPIQRATEPDIDFPRDALRQYQVGSVVVLLQILPDGSVTDVQVAASVGGPSMVEAVQRAVPHWIYERTRHSPNDCQFERTQLVTVNFAFR